jgi:uncharacterized protein (TIGR02145 family)
MRLITILILSSLLFNGCELTNDHDSCINAGKTCNDRNDKTFNDQYNDSCVCQGKRVVFKPGNGVTDVEGNHYKSFILGKQEWMQEDLHVKKFRNGDEISIIENGDKWGSASKAAAVEIPKQLLKSNSTLYNWYVVSDQRNVCPVGWHVPTIKEWQELIDNCGGSSIAGDHLLRISRLSYPEFDSDNSKGFAAELNGHRDNMFGEYFNQNEHGYWWTSTDVDSISAQGIAMSKCSSHVTSDLHDHKKSGLNLRCIKN